MIVGAMRIRNESRWIAQSIESQLPVVDRLIILDDHSDDNTREICNRYDHVKVIGSPFAGFNETRDKNFLMTKVEEVANAGDHVLFIDGDEVLATGSSAELQRLAESDRAGAYTFQVLYLWDRPDQVRVDRVYANFWRPSFFKLHPGARFSSSASGGVHCGNVPEPGDVRKCDVKILHYGYMLKEDRIRKYEWYNAPDKQPVPELEDGYKHMVIGDLFPAESRFRHAGPLEVRPL